MAAALAVLVSTGASAAWYWPFGSDDSENEGKMRISELIAPASELIEDASELAEDGKIEEAVEKYKQALAELDRVELENEERAKTTEFDTVRNKRIQVNSAIDTLLLHQVMANPNQVAITDTTALEKEYARLEEEKKNARSGRKPKEVRDDTRLVNEGVKDTAAQPMTAASGATRKERLREAMLCLKRKNYDAAHVIIRGLLAERANDAAALNLRASVETAEGNFTAAEKTLDQCIQSNPKSYYAYYNLAKLILQTRKEKGVASARLYYEKGRECGGPVDKSIEEALQ